MSRQHALKVHWLVQKMGYGRRVILTESIHATESAGRSGLIRAKKKYPLSTWRLVKQEEVAWWPR